VAEILTENIPNTILERNRHANLLGMVNVDDDGNSNTTTNATSTHNNDSI
jgi:hypothetical protein